MKLVFQAFLSSSWDGPIVFFCPALLEAASPPFHAVLEQLSVIVPCPSGHEKGHTIHVWPVIVSHPLGNSDWSTEWAHNPVRASQNPSLEYIHRGWAENACLPPGAAELAIFLLIVHGKNSTEGANRDQQRFKINREGWGSTYKVRFTALPPGSLSWTLQAWVDLSLSSIEVDFYHCNTEVLTNMVPPTPSQPCEYLMSFCLLKHTSPRGSGLSCVHWYECMSTFYCFLRWVVPCKAICTRAQEAGSGVLQLSYSPRKPSEANSINTLHFSFLILEIWE